MYIEHYLCHIVWNFHLNWLTFLEAMTDVLGVHFLSRNTVLIVGFWNKLKQINDNVPRPSSTLFLVPPVLPFNNVTVSLCSWTDGCKQPWLILQVIQSCTDKNTFTSIKIPNRLGVQGVSKNTFWNIFSSVKSFCVKFCKFVGNSYPLYIYQFL